MLGPRFNEQKLKANLGLVVTRLKLIEKKKTDQALRARPEIADYVRNAKVDRARVRVERIIREDYLVEAMELVEMYADLLAGRVGLMKQSKTLDEGLKTPVSTLIWATPRLVQYCQELKVVRDLLAAYYGKKFVEACKTNALETVCDKVMTKLDVRPPKKVLVEKYLIEICKNADVEFTPDPRIMASEVEQTANLIDTDVNEDFKQFNQNPLYGVNTEMLPPADRTGDHTGGSSSPKSGFSRSLPGMPTNWTPHSSAEGSHVYETISDVHQAPTLPSKGLDGLPNEKVISSKDPSGVMPNLPSNNDLVAPGVSSEPQAPVVAPQSTHSSASAGLLNLPSVPTNIHVSNQLMNDQSSANTDDVDFDDLSKRFENLKKKT